jgi:serine protease Do
MKLLLIGALCLTVGATTFFTSRAFVHANPRPALPQDLPSYREVVQRVLPAVVSIEPRTRVSVSRTSMPRSFEGFGQLPDGLPEGLRKELERFRKMPMPDVTPGRSVGSGFIVDPAGVILTNAHVVQGADVVDIRLHDGRTFQSRDIKRDAKTDLAVVRIDAAGALPCLKLGDSDGMEIGDRVLAVGAPLGLTGTVTHGIVSAKARDVNLNMYEDFLQTDAAINPGNSGGPLVNLAGEVIGVNTAIRSATGGFQGIGLAISSNLVRGVLDHLQRDGSVPRAYLGVQTQPLDAAVAKHLGLNDQRGVVLSRIMPDTPAARAGLVDGDVLTQLAGQPVRDVRHLQRFVAGLPIDKEIDVEVLRDGRKLSVKLKVEKQPEAFGAAEPASHAPATVGKLGARAVDMTPAQAKEFGYPEKTEGVVVVDIDEDSLAAGTGLRRGTLILQVDQTPIKTAAELQAALDKASLSDGVLLRVRTAQGGTTFMVVKATARG